MKLKRAIAVMLSVVLVLSSLVCPVPQAVAQNDAHRVENIEIGAAHAFAWPEPDAYKQAKNETLGLELVAELPAFQQPEARPYTHYASSPGVLYGEYESIQWVLKLGTGELSITGSGTVYNAWRDSSGNDYSSYIQTVTVGSGISGLSDYAFAYCENLRSVSLPESVAQIGTDAFISCKNLTTVNIPSKITEISEYAFAGCEKLVSMALPANLSTLGPYAFALCPTLETINFPSRLTQIQEGAFYGCTSLKDSALPAGLSLLGKCAFYGCTSLTQADIPCAVGEQAYQGCSALTRVSVQGNLGLGAFQQCSALTDVELADTITEIGPGAFNMCSSLKKIAIPSGVSRIQERAFGGCDALAEVVFAGGCQHIELYAFLNCTSLETIALPQDLVDIGEYSFAVSALRSVTIPESVRDIGNCAFLMCSRLTSVNIPAALNTLGANCFQECTALENVIFPQKLTGSLSSIGEYTFYRCTSLPSVTLPSGIQSVGNGAFSMCSSLRSVGLPDSMVSLGSGALGECDALESVTIPDSCRDIGEQLFYGCDQLKSVRLPAALEEIDPAVFYECVSLTDVTLPDTLQKIDSHAFAGCKALDRISLPQGLADIGDFAFMNCTKLSSIGFPAQIRTIGADAFANTALQRVELPESLESLGEEAFAMCLSLESAALPGRLTQVPHACFLNCERLTAVELPQGLSIIGDYAFANCSSLKGLNLSAKTSSIGEYAFANCHALSQIELTDAMKSIGKDAFANCTSLDEIYIGAQVSALGEYAFSGCTGMTNMRVSESNNWYKSEAGILYTKDGSELIFYPPLNAQETLVIPNTLCTLSPGALFRCVNIKHVVLPEGMTRIEARTFYGCTHLESVVIPDTVTYIDDYAFADCSNLRQIELSDHITHIGEGAFAYCSSLTELTLPAALDAIPAWCMGMCSSLRRIHMPEGVKSIGESAFFDCEALEAITLPAGLEEVGNMAFADCDSLREITLPAGIELVPGGLMKYCDALEKVTLEGGVYHIGDEAFSNCTQLTDVHFAGNAPDTIGREAFLNTPAGMIFHCQSSSEGFSVPVWVGPDEMEYHTATVYSGSCGENVSWSLDTLTGLMRIEGSGMMSNYAAVEERPWHEYRDLIQEVEIGEGITRLGSYNFSDCRNLRKISLPESLTETNYAAFANCTWLSECHIPGGLKQVAPCLFYGCYLLEEVPLNESCSEIGAYAFFDCRSLQDMTIPQNVKAIREGTFAYCISMNEVIIKGKLDQIGSGAFIGCDALTTVSLEEGLPAEMSEYAFSGIEQQLKILAGDETLSWKGSDGNAYSTVPSDVLSGTCGNNVTWKISAKERKLVIEGSGAINDYEENQAPWSAYSFIAEHLQVSSGITGIGQFAFANLYGLTSVDLGDTVKTIGDYAFAGCVALEQVHLPGGVNSVGEGVFSTCPLLRSVTLPSGMTAIPDYLFYGCAELEDVEIPSEVTAIGYSAFTGCSALTEIALPDGIQAIGEYAFAACDALIQVQLPASLKKVGNSAFLGCLDLKHVVWNQALSEIEAFAFANTGLTEVLLPDSVEMIGAHAFYLCDALAQVDLGAVKRIGEYAFGHTGLQAVTLPESVTTIGAGAFVGCASLSAIESDSPAYPSSDGVLYSGDLLLQYPAGKADEAFVLPAWCTGVGVGAFYGNSHLKRVELGDQVNTLGEAAFVLCSALESVSLGRGITLLPEAMFGQCESLAEIRFYGSAPTSIGSETFASVPEDIVFYYDSMAQGWTEGEWLGPDGVSYRTIALVVERLLLDAARVMLDGNGYARAQLAVSMQGQRQLEILSVSVNDERFAVEFSDENRTVSPGQVFDTCSIVPVTVLDACEEYTVEVSITWAGGAVKSLVVFAPNDALMYTMTVQDPADPGLGITGVFEGEDIWVTVTSGAGAPTRSCIVVLGVYRDGQMIASGAAQHPIEPSSENEFIFTMANCDVSSGCQYRSFLLDADTLAPLAGFAQCSSFAMFTASGEGVPIQLCDVRSHARDRALPSQSALMQAYAGPASAPTRVLAVDQQASSALPAQAYVSRPKDAWAGNTKITLIADKDGHDVLGVTISRKDQYISLDFNKTFDKNWNENLTNPEYKDTTAITASLGGFYSWAKPTSNAHKEPRNGLHASLDGYLFRREQVKPTHLLGWDNGWVVEGTPSFEIGSVGADLQVDAKRWGKHVASGSVDALKADYEFNLKNDKGESVLKVAVSGSVGSLKKSMTYIPGAQKRYRWKGKFGSGLGGGEFEIEMDRDALGRMLADWATDTVKELGETVREHVLELVFEHGSETYQLGEWYICTDEQNFEILPMSFVGLEESLINSSLPMVADKALPSLEDLNLMFNNEGGITFIPPVIPTNADTAQREIRSARDIQTSGTAKEKAALKRTMHLISLGAKPLQQDLNTIAGFMSSGMFNNFTEMQNSLSSSIYQDGSYLQFINANQGFVLQGYVVENVYR